MTDGADPKTDAPAHSRRGMHRHFATDEGVYGVILVAGMIVASGSSDADALHVFLNVVITVLVFWAAHVYAGTVSHYGFEHGEAVRLGQSLRAALQRSWGLLVSALIPASILLLGVTQAVDDTAAVWIALWTCVIVLAVLGYIAFARRRATWYIRVLGSLATAGFGILMIVLKAALH